MPDFHSLCDLSSDFPKRAIAWRLRTKTLSLNSSPALMGIVNVTPDSFSDGGQFFDHQQAVEHGLKLAEEGAAILDIGGESTRPNADEISENEELRRVIEVVQALAEQTSVPISIDTSKAKVAAEAIAAGAEIINDVTGLEGDPDMLSVAVSTKAGVCAMHMRGNPRTMQNEENLLYGNVVEEIGTYLRERKNTLAHAGIDVDRVCLDPGIGFAKTYEHNLLLLQNIDTFHQLEAPILVGHSRKGFLGKIIGDPEADRQSATIGVTLALARAGIQIIRLHDVGPAREALTSFMAAGGLQRISKIQK